MAKYLVTGGAGFIGCNLVARLLDRGDRVVVLDNLSRKGTQDNLDWLRTRGDFEFRRVDLRDGDAVAAVCRRHRDLHAVAHLAGQVAVTTSVQDPRRDFEDNALGTLNVLEGVRLSEQRPLVLYASTNKVYGGMEGVAIEEQPTRYAYRDFPSGIPETFTLDFHSPYGCSKGAADQYVRDYHRIYGIPTVVFRQSCIYGRRQFGVEDQGWVAWFAIAAVLGRPLSIYGDGKQVRDLLWVDDLIDAYLLAAEHPDRVAGRIYNVGGGPDNSLAVWREFGPMLEELVGRSVEVVHGPWRPGDQPVYVSDIRKVGEELGWQPRTPVHQGIRQLVEWVQEHRILFERLFPAPAPLKAAPDR